MAVVITSYCVLGGELKVSSGETVTKQKLAKKQKDVQMSERAIMEDTLSLHHQKQP